MKKIRILGTRGIPANHGGFETFAEMLALYLVSVGWDVTVYCQGYGDDGVSEKIWRNIRLVRVSNNWHGSIGTILFDLVATMHASRRKGLILTLGYNTALFCILYRLMGHTNLINMDGIEWRRGKWNLMQRAWLYLNERLACWFGNQLIADHPKIKEHLSAIVSPDKIIMIPYGANYIDTADQQLLNSYNLLPKKYVLVIARAEPENNVLEIVEAFSRKSRGFTLAILGNYEFNMNSYKKKVIESAGDEVMFLGAIYDSNIVNSLRFFSRLYIHGHTVGGTNPSLVEALGASLPILAHDNTFNRWVAGDGAYYFKNSDECSLALEELLDNENKLDTMRLCSIKQYQNKFTWIKVLSDYEALFEKWSG